MEKKYQIITDYIKDLSFEIPTPESFIDAAQSLDVYEIKIDISNKPTKNKMLELNCKLIFEAPKTIADPIHAEGCLAIIFKIIDEKLTSDEIRKIILVEIPTLYIKKLTDIITDIFHRSGFKEFKFRKEINFENLYEKQFTNLNQKH